MFDRLKKSLFGSPNPQPEESISLELAVAALLVEAARSDEDYTELEHRLIEQALTAQFSLGAEAARALRCKAEAAQAEALDIHRFTKVAKTMAQEDKLALMEHLWTIILSDGERDPHEDTMMRRLCGLIYVSDFDSGAARRRAESALPSGATD